MKLLALAYRMNNRSGGSMITKHNGVSLCGGKWLDWPRLQYFTRASSFTGIFLRLTFAIWIYSIRHVVVVHTAVTSFIGLLERTFSRVENAIWSRAKICKNILRECLSRFIQIMLLLGFSSNYVRGKYKISISI